MGVSGEALKNGAGITNPYLITGHQHGNCSVDGVYAHLSRRESRHSRASEKLRAKLAN